MIHSGEAIQFCEKLIAKIEKEHTISSSDLDDLNSIVQFARQKLKEIIS
jgi:hypothetical protein